MVLIRLSEDAPVLGGYADEVVATAAAASPLRAARVTRPDLPIPASMKLEDAVQPNVQEIVSAACAVVEAGAGLG